MTRFSFKLLLIVSEQLKNNTVMLSIFLHQYIIRTEMQSLPSSILKLVMEVYILITTHLYSQLVLMPVHRFILLVGVEVDPIMVVMTLS